MAMRFLLLFMLEHIRHILDTLTKTGKFINRTVCLVLFTSKMTF